MAGDPLLRRERLPLRHALRAHRRRVRTTRAVYTAARGREGRWRLARAHAGEARRLQLGIRHGDRLEELAAIGVPWLCEQLRGGAELHHAPQIQDQYALAQLSHERE